MAKKFDLVVIGTGSAASAAAYRCRAAGWNVAVIDSRPFGGTCALRGCDPKKVLVGAAELLDLSKRMASSGVAIGEARIDWPELMRFKAAFTEPVPQNTEEGFARRGIAAFHGRARFQNSTMIEVGGETLEGKYLVIATGARPARLNIPGEELLTTSDQFLELETLPKRILFVGGGYISFEFAHVAARAGSRARILHRGTRPLEGFDPDMVLRLAQATWELGIEVRVDSVVTAIEKHRDHLVVHADVDGADQTFETDLVVHGAGRAPDIDDLRLETARIRASGHGVAVNEYLQSVSSPIVYAAGDCADSGGLPLTPVAAMEGQVVAENLVNGNHRTPNYDGVPTVVFTVPSLASVGLQEDAARSKGLKFAVKSEDTSGWYSSRRVNTKHSAFKVLVEEHTQKVLGAHLLGDHAEEVINLFAIAIRFGLRASDLRAMPYAYPSVSSDVSYMV